MTKSWANSQLYCKNYLTNVFILPNFLKHLAWHYIAFAVYFYDSRSSRLYLLQLSNTARWKLRCRIYFTTFFNVYKDQRHGYRDLYTIPFQQNRFLARQQKTISNFLYAFGFLVYLKHTILVTFNNELWNY